MSNKDLENIPENLSKWKKLRIMNLKNTKIKDLPESIGELSSLSELEIENTLI